MNILAYTKPGYVINYDVVRKWVCILLSRSKNSIFARPKWPKSSLFFTWGEFLHFRHFSSFSASDEFLSACNDDIPYANYAK